MADAHTRAAKQWVAPSCGQIVTVLGPLPTPLKESFSVAYLASFGPFARLCFSFACHSSACLSYHLCHPWSDSFRLDICRFAINVSQGCTIHCDQIVTAFLQLQILDPTTVVATFHKSGAITKAPSTLGPRPRCFRLDLIDLSRPPAHFHMDRRSESVVHRETQMGLSRFVRRFL